LKDKIHEPPLFRALRNMPIKRKVLVVVMTVTVAALGISGFGILFADAFLYRRNLERDLTALAAITADNSTAALMFNVPQEAVEILNAMRSKQHVVAACLYKGREPFARYVRPGSGDACPPPPDRDGVRFGNRQIDVFRAVVRKGERIGTLVIVYDLEELYTRMRLYGLYVLAILLVSGGVALLLTSWLRHVIASPISQLARITAAVSETRDYGIRAQSESSDEVGALVHTFNDMLAGIEHRDGELRDALMAREDALAEARKARDFLRTTIASIGDAVITTDAVGCIVFANAVACALLRRREAEIADQPVADALRFIDEHTRSPLENPAEAVLSGRSAEGFTGAMLVAAGGIELPIDYSAAPILNSAGGVAGSVLVFRDISERRRAERELRAAREQLQMITDTMAAAVARCARDLRFVWVSRRYAERFGLSPGEVAGRPIGEVLGAQVLDVILPYIQQVLAGRRTEYEVRVNYSSIGWRWIRAVYVPTFDHSGAVDGWVADVTDITEIKEAQAEVVRMNEDLRTSNERLARSNEDLERFAFAASHDLQEPLRMMTTYTQLLERSLAGQWNGESRQFMHIILDGAMRMRGLLADLLAYSKLGGEPDEPARHVDLNRVIETVRKNLEVTVRESAASIEYDPLPGLIGHPSHFVQLFQNLISNAIKYRGEARPIVRIRCEPVNGDLRFAVSDNGMGIDPAYHERIFGVFKRLHGRKIPGTGIGLAICQRVVERHGGRIWVESRSGEGATFFFTIPARNT
jgi:PAS domain S-box-containing protein